MIFVFAKHINATIEPIRYDQFYLTHMAGKDLQSDIDKLKKMGVDILLYNFPANVFPEGYLRPTFPLFAMHTFWVLPRYV